MPRTTRKPLKVQGNAVNDIENFMHRTKRHQVSATTLIRGEKVNEANNKSKEMQSKEVQVNLDTEVEASDLTKPDETSEDYWRLLAEEKHITLYKVLEENEELSNSIEQQKKEIKKYKRMLEDAIAFVERIRGEIDNNDSGIDENDVSTADESQLTNESLDSDESAAELDSDEYAEQ